MEQGTNGVYFIGTPEFWEYFLRCQLHTRPLDSSGCNKFMNVEQRSHVVSGGRGTSGMHHDNESLITRRRTGNEIPRIPYGENFPASRQKRMKILYFIDSYNQDDALNQMQIDYGSENFTWDGKFSITGKTLSKITALRRDNVKNMPGNEENATERKYLLSESSLDNIAALLNFRNHSLCTERLPTVLINKADSTRHWLFLATLPKLRRVYLHKWTQVSLGIVKFPLVQ
ncbi:hypothetical protein C0J52_26116 [Blattella germanica]|nr:hypothetical protein C0J52_26116 [Blattella germanica]